MEVMKYEIWATLSVPVLIQEEATVLTRRPALKTLKRNVKKKSFSSRD
jgi:hypothetical protein